MNAADRRWHFSFLSLLTSVARFEAHYDSPDGDVAWPSAEAWIPSGIRSEHIRAIRFVAADEYTRRHDEVEAELGRLGLRPAIVGPDSVPFLSVRS